MFKKLGYWLLNYGGDIYRYSRKNFFKFLPANPLAHYKFAHPMLNFRQQTVISQFDKKVQDQLLLYPKYHSELEDQQDPIGIGALLQFILETENLKGDILELGTYKGGTTIILALFLKKINSTRRIYSCDTFSGLPYDDKFSRTKDAQGKFSDVKYDDVLQKIRKFGVNDKIQLIKGRFEKTLQRYLTQNEFSLVFVDCDLYDAVKYSLEFVYPRLNKGGIIAFDEYDIADRENPLWGETKAVDEFCSHMGCKVKIRPVPYIMK